MENIKEIKNKVFSTPPNPYWIASTPKTNYPSLNKDISVDVAIIGGGLAGISSGYLLSKAGLSIAIVEVDHIGQGTTAHTTAKITSQHSLIYDKLEKQLGREKAKLYAESNQAAIDVMEDIIKENNMDCDFSRQQAYIYTQSERYVKKIENEAIAAKRLGIPSHYIDSIPLPFSIKAAVRFDNQAQFHPRKYLLALADKIIESKGQIYEKTKAVSIDEGAPCIVKTQKGNKITAKYVIIASHFPFYDGLGFYFARMYPERSYGIGTIIKEKYPGGMYINAEDPSRSLRYQPLKEGELVIFIGERHKTGQDTNMDIHYENLIDFANDTYTLEDVPYRWSTQDYTTIDSVPYIGELTTKNPNIFVATGFKKWGMTSSTISAMIINDLILNKDNPWLSLYTPSRKITLYSVGSFIVQNTNVAKELISGKLEVLSKDLDIKNGEAKAVSMDGQRIGAYRDEKGKLHMVDTTCTHMGCELQWNEAEKTWDCPCHGSRFTYEGDIVEGPAINPLKHLDDLPNQIDPNLIK